MPRRRPAAIPDVPEVAADRKRDAGPAPVVALPAPLPGLRLGVFGWTAWSPPVTFTDQQWLDAVVAVARAAEDSKCWWLGDLYLNGGRDALAKLRHLTEQEDWVGPPWGTFQVYGSVAKTFPSLTRVKAVSFAHHRLVAARDDRAELLAWAETNKASVSALRAEIQRRNMPPPSAEPSPLPAEPPPVAGTPRTPDKQPAVAPPPPKPDPEPAPDSGHDDKSFRNLLFAWNHATEGGRQRFVDWLAEERLV